MNRRGFIARKLADVFQKNEKKNRTTSVYRLQISLRASSPGRAGKGRRACNCVAWRFWLGALSNRP